MDIFNRLDILAEKADEEHEEYLTDVDAFMSDQEGFREAYEKSMVSSWAVGRQLSSEYDVAKKIIDSF